MTELEKSRYIRTDRMIKIDLDTRNRSELERIFQGQCDQSVDDIANVVAKLAFDDWMGWLTGDMRYTSLTDQYIERVANLYTNLMPEKEPDAKFLYNRLSVPYGRARYITQVLLERQLRSLNNIGQKQLIAELEKVKLEVDQKGSEIPKVEIKITRRAGMILVNAVQEMLKDDKEISLTEISSLFPDIRRYTLSPDNIDSVLEKVKGLKF